MVQDFWLYVEPIKRIQMIALLEPFPTSPNSARFLPQLPELRQSEVSGIRDKSGIRIRYLLVSPEPLVRFGRASARFTGLAEFYPPGVLPDFKIFGYWKCQFAIKAHLIGPS